MAEIKAIDENVISVEADIQEAELIPLSNAAMFGLVMAKEKNCKGFIERALEINVAKLQVLNVEKVFEVGIGIKGTRLDVYAEDDTGKVYDIEMQVKSQVKDYLGQRTRYYQSMMDTSILKKGSRYWQLPDSYIIFVCTFDPFDANRKYYTFNNLCREQNDIELRDGCTKVFLYTKGCKGQINTELENVLKYIETKEPNDEYTYGLHDDVMLYNKDPKRREAIMTVKDEEDLLKFIIEKKDAVIADKDAENRKLKQENEKKDAELANSRAESAKNAIDMNALREQLRAAGLEPVV